MAGDAPLGSFAEVAPEVEPVRDLDCGGRPDPGALGEERGTVTAHDLDPRVFGQPGGDRARFTIRQQVSRPAGLDVDQYGPVDTALAHRVLIDADHPRDLWLGFREGVDQPQDRVPAHPRPEDIGQPGTGAAGQGEADLGHRPHSFGPLAVPPGQARNLLDERPPHAGADFAREAPNAKSQHHPPPRHGKIGGKSQVGAVQPPRPAPAARAPSPGRPASDTDSDHLAIVLHGLHPDPRIRQEEQPFQSEQYVAHSPEPSTRKP